MQKENGYYYWNKDETGELSKHFKLQEFTCHCDFDDCIEQMLEVALLDKLELLRGNAGVPITVTSAYRCQRYQQKLSETPGIETAKGISSHEIGQAVDVKCKSLNMHELVVKAEPFFDNIGVGLSFLHLDVREGGPRRWKYSY
jgi:uncharacterized protein YcbK (DUF882 family)